MTSNAQRTTGLRAVWVVLCLLALGNVSHRMVLCVGAHGHVAIEPAGHSHCADTGDDHDCGPAGPRAGAGGHWAFARCGACVDIPLSLGVLDGWLVSGGAKTIAPVPTAYTDRPESSTGYAAAIPTFTRYPLFTFHTPLTSIVLQV